MPSGYIYKGGPHNFDNVKSTASTAITRGDAVKMTTGAAVLATTGAKVLGISNGPVKTSGDTATTSIQVLLINNGRTVFQAYEKRASGSLAATDLKSLHDLSGASGAMGFDSSATTHNDLFLQTIEATGASNTGRARIIFGDPSWLTAAVV